MQVEWLHSFLATTCTKSLSKAGEKLNVSQTALSRQIKNLEDSFGVSLFHRSTTGMELTPEGELLRKKAQQWLADLNETKRRLINLASTKQIVIGSLPSLAAYYLPEKLLRLKADGVNANIRVSNNSHEILDDFFQGGIDVAIVDGNVTIPKKHWVTELLIEPYYAVLPNSHPLSTQSKISVSDLAHEPFVLQPSRCDFRRSLMQALERHGSSPHIAFEVPYGEAMLGFVAAGAGITIVPEMVANHMGDVTLVAVPIADLGLKRIVCLIAKSAEQFQFVEHYFPKEKRAQ